MTSENIDFYDDAVKMYKMWQAVEEEIATHGQASSIGGKSYTLADLGKVQEQKKYYMGIIKEGRVLANKKPKNLIKVRFN